MYLGGAAFQLELRHVQRAVVVHRQGRGAHAAAQLVEDRRVVHAWRQARWQGRTGGLKRGSRYVTSHACVRGARRGGGWERGRWETAPTNSAVEGASGPVDKGPR